VTGTRQEVVKIKTLCIKDLGV